MYICAEISSLTSLKYLLMTCYTMAKVMLSHCEAITYT